MVDDPTSGRAHADRAARRPEPPTAGTPEFRLDDRPRARGTPYDAPADDDEPIELGELEEPTASMVVVGFGGATIVVERGRGCVTMVLPTDQGTITGTTEQARQLAAVLAATDRDD